MRVVVQYIDDCPNWQETVADLRDIAARGLEFEVATERIDDERHAERAGFVGSPTVLVDGRDPFADPSAPPAYACRVYRTSDGFTGRPPFELLERELRRAVAG